MPSSGYTAITFVANEQPTTAKWNLIGSNDSAFNLGTGLEDSVILNRHLATGVLQRDKFDWTTFANNMKWASNSSAPALSNSSQDLAASGLTLSFTVTGTPKAIVFVSLGIASTSDFEFRPEIRLGGVVQQTLSPAAALASTNGRGNVRTTNYVLSLADGVNNISAGVFLAAGANYSLPVGAGVLSVIVLGNVTA